MLAILALESERARAYVVGEDLGTVEDATRQKLAQHNLCLTGCFGLRRMIPKRYPKEALAAVTTHDLPTVAGLWTGADLRAQKVIGLKPNEESTHEIHERLAKAAGLNEQSRAEDAVAGAYKALAKRRRGY